MIMKKHLATSAEADHQGNKSFSIFRFNLSEEFNDFCSLHKSTTFECVLLFSAY
jgi:hypothetical protein